MRKNTTCVDVVGWWTPMLVIAVMGCVLAADAADSLAEAHTGQARSLRAPEVLDDPYLPNADPAGGAVFGPAQRWLRGDFESVQVNVDAFGNNIVGDAANEPSIAIDPTDPKKMAIGWRQFDTIASNFRQAGVAYSQDGGQSWTFPGVLDPGQFRSDPVLDADADGNFYYYSLSTLSSAELFKSMDGGVTWSEPVPAFGGDKAWMVVDRTDGIGRGNIYAKWQTFFNCCGPNTFTRSTNGGASFTSPVTVSLGPSFGTIAVGPDGDVHVAGIEAVTGQNFSRIVVARSSNAKDPSATPFFDLALEVDLGGALGIGAGPNPVGLLGQVWVAVDHSLGSSRGNVYVLSSVDPPGSDPLDVIFARSTNGGVTWSEPIRVNDDSPDNGAWQWFGTMSVAPNGRIDVIFNDTRNSGGDFRISELFYSASFDAGETWSSNIAVSPPFNSHVGWPNQDKLGDYYDMVSDNAGASLAYAATFNGEQDVYFLRIGADCNDNGISDATDVASGTSPDGNANGVPDECETVQAPVAPGDPTHLTRKNRFVSFDPNNIGRVAFKVEWDRLQCGQSGEPCLENADCGVTDTCQDFGAVPLGWVGDPVDASTLSGSVAPPGTFFANLVPEPVTFDWSGIDTVHLGGCEIAPVHRYRISATLNELDIPISEPLVLETIQRPGPKFWGDVVGEFTGLEWTPPNGVVNVNDVLAWIATVISGPAPHITWVDLAPETPNFFTNADDLVMILQQGFQGKSYPPPPFANQETPADCP